MKKRLGLAFGGGGSRALCHLGVLSVLAQEGIEISAIAGSSLGALLAAMYAFEPDAEAVRGRALSFFRHSHLFGRARKPSKSDGLRGGFSLPAAIKKYFRTAFVFNMLAARPSLFKKNPADEAVAALLPDRDIRETAVPFACNALDMTRGLPVVFTEGSVRHAVAAGTTVAIVFPPYRWNGGYYADAAPVSCVPVRAARSLGAEVVLAVDIRTPVEPMERFRNGFDVVSRLEAISSRILNDEEIASADVTIRPGGLDVFWGDFSDVDAIARLGEEAARSALPAIRRALK
ncbi:MAG: patatin-like phospholipase family protein [Planctomycetota bacterium]